MQNISAIGSVRIGTAIDTQEMAIGCQGREDQNTETMACPQKILTEGSAPSPHSGNTREESCLVPAKKSPGDTNRRRKRALVMREIPLYMLPAALSCCVRAQGEKVYRVVIVRTHWHHYTIKVRCSTKKATGHIIPSQQSAGTVTTCTGKEAADNG
jgi:hypothetical protein